MSIPPQLSLWPTSLVDQLAPIHELEEIRIGFSGDRVFRVRCHCRQPSPRTVYIKAARPQGAKELKHERLVLAALNLHAIQAPTVVSFIDSPHDGVWMAMTEVSGEPAHEWVNRMTPEALMRVLAMGLRRIHDLPWSTTALPQRRLDGVFDEAQSRATRGLIELDDLHAERQGWSTEQLLAALHAQRPADVVEELVFTHGDYCLPNILLTPEGLISGYVDWGRAGVADRYQDIALLLRSFRYNTGTCPRDVFCEAYGIDRIDTRKEAFYRLLDEFF